MHLTVPVCQALTKSKYYKNSLNKLNTEVLNRIILLDVPGMLQNKETRKMFQTQKS